jgi:hypothetical protein
MSAGALYDLERLLDESLRMCVAPDCDIDRLREWGEKRAALFATLQEQDFELTDFERRAAAGLIEEILRVDATMMARMKRELTVLERKISDTDKVRRLLAADAQRESPALLRRIA